MKGVLLLGLVGAALYMALVVSHDFLSTDKTAKNAIAGKAPRDSRSEPLRSWGTDLPALASRASPSLGTPLAKAIADDKNLSHPSDISQPTPYDPTEWVRVKFAARLHPEASISSRTVRFYQPGTPLQVVTRENGWAQISDPTSRQVGWVLEQYLGPADDPTTSATAAIAYKALPEPTQVKPVLSAKKHARVSRPAIRMPDDIEAAQFESRWERRAERRRGLFFFGRFAGPE
jgi:hypothetical protein